MIPTINELLEGKSTDTIAVFDVDDSLIFSKNQIHYKEPGQDWKKVGTDEYAKIRKGLHKDTEYNFIEFKEYHHVLMGIMGGQPNIPVLQMMDKAIIDGYKIGIITARGNQKAVWDALNNYLLFRDQKGNLQPLPKNQFNKSYVFAVGDPATQKAFKDVDGSSLEPAAIKAFILQKFFGDKLGFKHIYFYDDDHENYNTVKNLNDERIEAVKV